MQKNKFDANYQAILMPECLLGHARAKRLFCGDVH